MDLDDLESIAEEERAARRLVTIRCCTAAGCQSSGSSGVIGALEAAIELAERIAANGPLAVLATKQIALRGGDWAPEQRWDQAAALSAPVFVSQDAREGARAFAEKRGPVWHGR